MTNPNVKIKFLMEAHDNMMDTIEELLEKLGEAEEKNSFLDNLLSDYSNEIRNLQKTRDELLRLVAEKDYEIARLISRLP
jgi:CCR4-NOT transcriptional regulation complex NOT5 subunit